MPANLRYSVAGDLGPDGDLVYRQPRQPRASPGVADQPQGRVCVVGGSPRRSRLTPISRPIAAAEPVGRRLGSRCDHLAGEDCGVEAVQRADVGEGIPFENNEVGIVADPDVSLAVTQAAGIRGEGSRGR
jgi:hypothetical protein